MLDRGASCCLMLSFAMLTVTGCPKSNERQATVAASYPDTVAVAKAAGYDYESLATRALAKDRQALHILFRLTAHAGFDGASSEGNAGVLGMLLKRLGDQHFSECLREESQDIRKAVWDNIEYDMDYAYEPPRTEFPLTYATCFTIAEKVESFVSACRREVRDRQPDCEVAHLGLDAVPELLKMISDERKVWVRIGPPQGGPESRFVDVAYLYADDEGPRSSVAEFALLCICEIREPSSGTTEDFERVWNPVMHEFTDYDGKVSDKTIREIKAWYESARTDKP